MRGSWKKKLDFLKNNPMRIDESADDINLLKNTLQQLKSLAQNVITSTEAQDKRQDLQSKR